MNPVTDYIIRGIADETGHPFDVVFRVWQQDLGYDSTITALIDMHAVTMRTDLDDEGNHIIWHS